MIVGAGQGRNFSLKFSSLIRFSYSLWISIPWAHEGSMWICSFVLVELQAQQCRGNNCVFSIGSTGACWLQLEWQGKESRTCLGRNVAQNGKSCWRSCCWMPGPHLWGRSAGGASSGSHRQLWAAEPCRLQEWAVPPTLCGAEGQITLFCFPECLIYGHTDPKHCRALCSTAVFVVQYI